MSQVYARNRGLSEREFFTNAIALRTEVTRVAVSDIIPKSYRFVLSVPMANTARDVVNEIVTADAFYPNTEHNVEMRRHHLTLAIASCGKLIQDMQCAIGLGIARPKRLTSAIETADREIALLKGARKGVRLIGR